MGSGLNKVILIGNLGRDCDLRYTRDGTPVASLNLAVNEVWRDKSGEKKERVEWVKVNLWGKTADALAEWLRKGRQIYVEGKLVTRKWTDKNDVIRYTTEVRADHVMLLGSPSRNGDRSERTERTDEPTPLAANPADEPYEGQF